MKRAAGGRKPWSSSGKLPQPQRRYKPLVGLPARGACKGDRHRCGGVNASNAQEREIGVGVVTHQFAEQRCVACIQGDSSRPKRNHRERGRLLHLETITGKLPVR